MKRGNLIIYDLAGNIITQSGDAEGSVLPHQYPIRVPYIELEFGATVGKRIVSVDVGSEPHQLVLEDIEQPLSREEMIAQLQEQLASLQSEGGTVDGV